jgi:hypothetical protein
LNIPTRALRTLTLLLGVVCVVAGSDRVRAQTAIAQPAIVQPAYDRVNARGFATPDSNVVMLPPMRSAFGIRAGWVAFTQREPKVAVTAFYQVPIGSVLFTPEVTLLTGGDTMSILSEGNSAFEFGVRVALPFTPRGSTGTEMFGGFGFGLTVWGDRASANIPLSFSVDYPLSSSVQLDLTALVSPFVYLGGEGKDVLFGILVGFRFPSTQE